jgi:hypothetical protein
VKPMMHGLDPRGNWDVDTKEGMARAKEWMERHVHLCADQARWIIPRSGSIVVIDKKNKTAILVLSMMPRVEDVTKRVFEAIGWKWEDRTK